ncbi:MAG: hypothetical protein ABIY62_06805, partial [Ginsengibacter sp.]
DLVNEERSMDQVVVVGYCNAKKLHEEVSRYKEIPVVSNVTQQHVLDNYYQVKMEVKRLIGEEVERLNKEKDN